MHVYIKVFSIILLQKIFVEQEYSLIMDIRLFIFSHFILIIFTSDCNNVLDHSLEKDIIDCEWYKTRTIHELKAYNSQKHVTYTPMDKVLIYVLNSLNIILLKIM